MAPKKPSDPTFASQVEQALLRVPSGRVVTYGGLALLAGRPRAARVVGMPCHRVVSASGELSSRSFREEQAQRLRAEGVQVENFRVDLSRYGWDGISEE